MKHHMPHLLVIGGASADILHTPTGETISAPGGAGMYTAMAAHRCGASVSLVAPRPDPLPEALWSVEYRYDTQNRLIGRVFDPDGETGTADIEQTRYVYDGSQIVLEFEKTGSGDLTAADLSHRYLWGPAVDQIVADEQVEDLLTPGEVLWPLTDHLACQSTRALTHRREGR